MRRFDFTPHAFVPSAMPEEPFEIVEVPKIRTPEVARSIVETEDAGNREDDPLAKFLSDKTQRAVKDERSKIVGEFKAGELFSKPVMNGFPPDIGETEAPESLTPGQLNALSLKDLSVSKAADLSQNDSVNKDVAEGGRTVLSTREFRYFGYYQRIRDLLRQHWSPNIQAKLMKLWQMGKVVNADEFTTEVHVLLDRSGRVQKIAKVATCGNLDLDSAAVEAFERAGPFPNPPLGMLDDDGYVRINWSFILTTEAAPRVQFTAPGGPP